MKKVVEFFRQELATIRAGRATPALVNNIKVDYYGTSTPLNQMATISAPEPRLLVIQPWDKSVIEDVERAILKSDLGITPNNDGTVIRLAIPQLTEERRTELVKTISKKAEEQRVNIRNIRREANEMLRDLENDGEITEDQYHRALDDVQELTDTYIDKVDSLLAAKEEEIMEV
jgi:ribosome recycling factor